jgi:hypothetical protein
MRGQSQRTTECTVRCSHALNGTRRADATRMEAGRPTADTVTTVSATVGELLRLQWPRAVELEKLRHREITGDSRTMQRGTQPLEPPGGRGRGSLASIFTAWVAAVAGLAHVLASIGDEIAMNVIVIHPELVP